MHEAIDAAGAGSGGTRNISGTTHYHVELEAELADLHGKEAALLFTSGFVSNDATLVDAGETPAGADRFFRRAQSRLDDRGHPARRRAKSACSGTTISPIWKRSCGSADPAAPKLIAFESVYSMDGDFGPDRGDLRSGREIRRADLSRRSPWRRALRPARRRRGGARRRDAAHRHRRRHARQGLRRDGRLYRRERRDRRLHPLFCAGIHLHDVAAAGDRGRRAGERPPSEGKRCRTRARCRNARRG